MVAYQADETEERVVMNFVYDRKIGFCLFLVALVAVVGFGCGGDGGGSSDVAAPTDVEVPSEGPGNPPPSPMLGGVGFKGPIVGGMVQVYALDVDGNKGALLGTTATDAEGHYDPPIDLGSYSGDVLIEISGGTYEDEATGAVVDNGDGIDDVVLRAAVTGVSGAISVMVTPFTEIAYRLATQTDLNVDEANYLVGSMAGVSNIVRTEPVLVTEEDVCDSALPSQLEYGLLMAMISQLIENDNGIDTLEAAIQAIVDDLSPLDDYPNQLENVGDMLLTALSDFIADDVRNQSCIDDEAQTLIDDAIAAITATPVVIPADASNLAKTKQLVGDFRDTVQIIYNYRDYGVRGIMQTPFDAFADELQNEIIPELSETVGRIGWIIGSAFMINQTDPPTLEFYSGDGFTLTFTPPEDGLTTFEVVEDATANVIDTGSLTLVYGEYLGQPYPSNGSFDAIMGITTDMMMTVDLNFAGALQPPLIPSEFVLTLSGSMTAQGLTVTLDPTSQVIIPIDSLDPMIPDSIFISGSIQTDTTLMEGNLDISLAYNEIVNPEDGLPVGLVPAAFTFQGSFQALEDGNPTGGVFHGTITGAWQNATSFEPFLPISEDNFRQWSATFNGQIEDTGRPTITMLLSVTQSEYDTLTLGAGYQRTNLDGTVVSLTGDGIYSDDPLDDFDFKVLTLSLTNQDGLIVEIIFRCAAEFAQDKFEGAIETSGGSPMADLYTTELGIPMVEYVDGYIEPIF